VPEEKEKGKKKKEKRKKKKEKKTTLVNLIFYGRAQNGNEIFSQTYS